MSLKSIRTLSVALLCSLPLLAQAVELDTPEQRFSYTLGFQFGQQLKQEGVKVDAAAFTAAIDDVTRDRALQLSMDQMREALQDGRERLLAEKNQKAEAALVAGSKFLEQNKSKEGVKTLDSGLQYIVLKEGKGESPKPESEVTVNYRGTLVDGTEFDSSYKRGQPSSFKLSGVIPGFREAITRMQPGAKWKVFLPPELGYGPKGAGGMIGPNETLIFEIELLSLK